MSYTMFYDRFPDIAERETRSLIILDDPELPPDTYALTELYCDEPGCDCRRVMFNVFADERKDFVAVIAYGWESKDYYREWAGENDPEVIKELKGPVLNRLSPQSELAPALFKKIKKGDLKRGEANGFVLPASQMARGHVRFISDVLYVYNRSSDVGKEEWEALASLEPYAPLTSWRDEP